MIKPENVIVYTQYSDDGETVRMSLHPFDAPFGHYAAPSGFRFKHRVVVMCPTRKGTRVFRPSCYSQTESIFYPKGSLARRAYEDWLSTNAAQPVREEAAAVHVEFEALQWLLEGEDNG